MKKIIVFVLSALLVLAMLPLTALAEGAYTVSYEPNGADSGFVPADMSSYDAGVTVTVSSNMGLLGKTGFTFNGWNTASDGSGISYAEGGTLTMPEGNVTLFAQWAPVACTLKFDAMGGTPVSDWMGHYGDVISAAPITTYAGYDFLAWFTDALYTTPVVYPYTVTGDATIYAKWAPISAYLTGVTVSAGTLSRPFAKTVFSYKLQLAETEGAVTFTPALENPNATLVMWTNRDHARVTGPSITVNVENNKTVTVKIKVTYAAAAGTETVGEDTEDLTHVYTFVIKRDKSTDNNLSSLTASAGTFDKAFDPAVTSYKLSLDSSTSSVTIVATAASPSAKVKPAITCKLKGGQTKTITIKVKPQSGPSKVYTVTITRAKSTGGSDTPVAPGSGNTGNSGNTGGNGKGNGKGNDKSNDKSNGKG